MKITTIPQFSILSAFAFSLASLASVGTTDAAVYSLNNGTGDGTVSVGVDGFGAFGSSVGTNATNAAYNPVGAGSPAGTSYESGVAIRFGASGSRSFLTSGDIGGSGGLTNPTVTGTPTSGASSFVFGGLSFNLTQTLTPVFTGLVQTGSVLTQSYGITNLGTTTSSFELLRYLDGDLQFDGSIDDGGGRLIAGSTEILFETDSATGSSDATTFVGITGEGGTIPASGRFEIDEFSGLRSRIVAGSALDDTVTGDGNADGFINAGAGYDVTLALNNAFTLGSGASTTYTTRTIFGAGAPADVPPPSSVPEGGQTLAMFGIGLGGLALLRRREIKAA